MTDQRAPSGVVNHFCRQMSMRSPTLLLIEDDRDTREIYGLALRRFGYTVLEASNGHDGVRVAREARPDLILMDMGLPGLHGWEATRLLRLDPETALIPVIAVTVHTTELDRARASVAGCDRFVPKPCSVLELRGHVEGLLSLS